MNKVFYIILIVGLAFLVYSNYVNKSIDTPSSTPNRSTPSSIYSFSEDDIEVESVKLDKSNKYAYRIYGMVRNKDNRKLKGMVKIKYLNASGDIIGDTKTYVNDGDYFSIGQAASFEYYGDPKEFEGVVDFDVVFSEL
jgi:hypothetical protein